MWDLHMSSMMVKAADTAGLPHPWVVTEPAAAAVYMMHEDFDRPSMCGPRLKRGHGPNGIPLLVADVGGGTAVGDNS